MGKPWRRGANMVRNARPCSIADPDKKPGCGMGEGKGLNARNGTVGKGHTVQIVVAFAGILLRRIRADWAAETRSGRLVLWLPVMMGLGVLFYFSAPQEPALLACLFLSGLSIAGAVLARHHALSFGVLLALSAMGSGFTIAAAHTAWITHESVAPPPFPVRLTGYVEKVERRAGSDRILLRLDGPPVRGLDQLPERVRLTLKKGAAPPVGARIAQLAQLLPPLGAAMPGAHDFGRAPWFAGIGAIGFGLGAPKIEPGGVQPLSVRFAVMMDRIRAGLSKRIHHSLDGVTAAIAVALVSGDRTAITPEVEERMRVSGLTHILSISGLHMALVAGTLFAIARGGLALFPGLALGWPIKSMAAILALGGSAFYLMLSGNDPPAQRSFIMVALVLVGVMVGRKALTLRTVAVAAIIMMLLSPIALLGAGTQMSFAATIALVGGYEAFSIARIRPKTEGWKLWLIVVPLVFMLGTAATTLLAGTATAPFGAYHFHRAATYGLLSNLAAMPAVTFLVMPFGLIGVLLIPLGWDGLAWPVMGWGIEVMVAVSDWVASLPGADVPITWVNGTTLAWLTLALLCACLLHGTLRLSALPFLVLAALSAGPPPQPDILIAPNGRTVAVRGSDGRLSILNARRGRLTAEQWLGREGDRRTATSPELANAFTCDALGCTAALPDSKGRIAVSYRAEGLEADCLHAQIIVTEHMPPGECAARIINTDALARTGTLAIYSGRTGLHEVPTRSPVINRPWLPAIEAMPSMDLPETWPQGSASAEAWAE